MLKQLQAVKMELRKRMHDPIAKTGAWLNQMLKGYLNYYAVPGNSPSLWWYFNEMRWALAQVAQATQPACIEAVTRQAPARSARAASSQITAATPPPRSNL
jgi:hypothetical protein